MVSLRKVSVSMCVLPLYNTLLYFSGNCFANLFFYCRVDIEMTVSNVYSILKSLNCWSCLVLQHTNLKLIENKWIFNSMWKIWTISIFLRVSSWYRHKKIHILVLVTVRKLTSINAPSAKIGIFTALFNTSFGIVPIIAGIFTVWVFNFH